MKDDPTIARIREVRHRISGKYNHDPKKIVEYYIKLQKKHKNHFLRTDEIKDKKIMYKRIKN